MNPTLEKLQLNQYKEKLVLHKPDDIRDLDVYTFDTEIKKPKYDLIFVFIFKLEEFLSTVNTVIQQDLLNPNGYLFFAYPKKGNKQYKDYIGRDDFFPAVKMDEDGYVNDSNIKFNRMCSFSDVFTLIGLKYLLKRQTNSNKPSQCVGDYIDRIPDLINHFSDSPTLSDFYKNLTPGYQRDWARYVYSAQTEATRQKRLAEMADILGQGYKTKDLYKQGKK